VIDKHSPLYLKKLVVIDLISNREFECLNETEGGNRIVRDLREKDLQTVVPKPGETVLILRGPQQGEKAQVFQRDKKKEKVVVQTVN
jgi:transcription antitermination factor NusG